MKKAILFFLLVSFFSIKITAQGGMWIPSLLADLNEKEMQSLGMKMTAEDIYSVNSSSLKDAIVHFGGFCTGEIISKQGLVLTNHHCGFSAIQTHSTLEDNYLQDGFWAASLKDEKPNEGLFVRFIVRIDDVTNAVLAGVTADMNEKERQSAIDKNIDAVTKSAVKESYQEVSVKPFYKGNQYFLFVTETYRDVRLVGAPPSAIGKFGADTDNWVWPRHTGDFSIFRIYAGKDNKPAEYSPDNVPFKPRHYLPVSLDGVSEDDFTLVFGFPGSTDEYLTASGVDLRVNKLNPVRISVRDESLDVLGEVMRKDPAQRLKYASKQSNIANGWKKWIGEIQGVQKSNAIEKKKAFEDEFMAKIKTNKSFREAYGSVIMDLDGLYKEIEPYAISRDYVSEINSRNIEMFYVAGVLARYAKMYENSGLEGIQDRLPGLINFLEGYYKDFSPDVDQEIFKRLMKIYFDKVDKTHQSTYARDQYSFAGGNMDVLAKTIYTQSILTKGDRVIATLKEKPESFFKALAGDPGYMLRQSIQLAADEKISPAYNRINDKINLLSSKYMKAQMEVFPDKRFFPDANSTLRVTYGQVKGYQPRDAVTYDPVTYLDGIIEKYVPGDYEFDVPEKLRKLYQTRDYGQYADKNGKVPVCFIGTNHTSGGNSGSPAIDAYGNLIGLNFDRVWEGTMSDVNYDPNICRNIMVDARYILFIIDKYAGATRLIEEMDLVHPKKK
ncbi:MAG: S46 family peptidase [Saprospiraceae bacterium]|nr:S46 family peptidase [Saprospiraceae bacterium]MCB9322761.1 S46 family peptidase [Lewinellaceae bacterium]